MINIRTNSSCIQEKKYIFYVVFSEFLGIPYTIQFDNTISDEVIITLGDGEKGRSLIVRDFFFQVASNKWLAEDTLPQLPLNIFKVVETSLSLELPFSEVVVLFGNPAIVDIDEGKTLCGLDLFGSIFFMLSRYEEMVLKERDRHDRFSAKSSTAFRAGFLMRPIVNEYLEILWQLLIHLGASLVRKNRTFQTILTCDVDWPFNPINQSYRLLTKNIVSNIVRSFKFGKGLKMVAEFYKAKMKGWEADSHNTFKFMMDLAEKNNITMVFYFICDHSGGKIDGNYTLDDPKIEGLMREIHQRGHKIGLHTSYNTYLDELQTIKEAALLRSKLEHLSINQVFFGSRQHYLRYRTSTTANNLDKANSQYDSTLSYADHAGFRCGTCYEYTMYNLEERAKLRIKERPLVAMETSIISANYMNMGYSSEALKVFTDLKTQCSIYNGDFIVLWHNSFFHDKRCFNILEEVLNFRA
ncbi:polysaccharide deacetylase family protein [Parapedobacter sp.]